jgi:hypothetical protein
MSFNSHKNLDYAKILVLLTPQDGRSGLRIIGRTLIIIVIVIIIIIIIINCNLAVTLWQWSFHM